MEPFFLDYLLRAQEMRKTKGSPEGVSPLAGFKGGALNLAALGIWRFFMALYLGLDPSGWKTDLPILHYPVIRIEPRKAVKPPDWNEVSHLLFTSKSAVAHWDHFEGKTALAIGEATAEELKKRGVSCFLAPFATQEGMIELLKTLDLQDAYLFWPRSSKARDVLELYLQTLNVRFQIVDLYDTHYQKLEPVPSLDQVEEIIFTSPSTVDGFLQIFGSLPKDKKLTPIGPITAKKIQSAEKCFFC